MNRNYDGCVPSNNLSWRKAFIKDSKKYRVNNNMIPKKDKIRLFSYNVHYWTDPDSNIITHQEIMKKINYLEPDLIGLQEVLIPENNNSYLNDNRIIKNTLKPLDKYKIETISVSKGCSGQETTFGNLLGSKFNIQNTHKLFFKNNKVENRGAILTIVEPIYGKSFLLIVLHLDVYDDKGDIRRKQLEELFEYIDKTYPKNIAIMMMGDFNCLKEEDYTDDISKPQGDYDTIKMIEEWGLEDVFDKLNYSVWSARRVDYIFIKNFNYEVSGTYVYYDDLSDHFALIVDMS